MPKVMLICGKICSGKTTYSKKLCTEGKTVLLSADEIMLFLFDQCCGEMHMEYERRIKNYLFRKLLELIEKGNDVILDWGFWTREERDWVKEFYKSRGIDCELYYIPIDDETWELHVNKRNAAVLKKEAEAYYINLDRAQEFAAMFEEPAQEEIDVIIN